MGGETHSFVLDGSGEGRYQPMKTAILTQGWNLRERPRPTAYIFEGPYADEVAGRMLIAGIEVKRLAKDVTVDVQGWHFAARPSVDFRNSGGGGWGSNNRNVKIYPIPNRQFKKDSYIVFLSQLMTHLVPMYMEPDIPFSAGNGIMLQYMSVALGGAGSGNLSENLVGVEMPIYRYIGDVKAFQTYDMDFFLPLISRGAVPRFFNFHNQEEVAAIANKLGLGSEEIKVYDYDIQVHARPGNRTTEPALKDGKFDILLPTDKNTNGYFILKKDGTYEKLTPHSSMLGWNVGTVVVANHGALPFTVDVGSNNRPVVGDGSYRTVPNALPIWDDLVGVRIVEVVKDEILSLFKDGKLPPNTIATEKGIKYTDLFVDKGTILSESMLDGWLIINVTPSSGNGWRANIVNGAAVITFTKDVYDDQTVIVTLQKTGQLEMKEIEVTFAGERESIIDKIIDRAGCNAGAAFLALLALCPLFVRKRA
jgi:hypothetical protein